MSRMHNPPHPGEVLKGLWLDPAGISVTAAADALHVTRKHVSRIINGHAAVTAEMALRLAAWLKTTPESWLAMQASFDLWQAEQDTGRPQIQAADFQAMA
jgi:addiction module HigA family antidote